MEEQKESLSVKKEKLYKALTSGNGLQYILNEASQLFKNPVFAYDTSMRCIASAQYGVQDDPLMNVILQESYIPINNVEIAQRKETMREILHGKKMSRICKVDFVKNRFISSQFEINGKVSGFIDVIESCNTFKEEEDISLHEVLREIIEYDLIRDQNMCHSKGDALEYFLLYLLQTDKLDQDIIMQRAKVLGLHVSKKWLIVVARYTGDDQHYIPSPHIIKNLQIAFTRSVGTIYQDRAVFLVPVDYDIPPSFPELKSLSHLIDNRKISLGFSTCFTDLLGIKEGYLEANIAIELGWRISNNEALFFHYETYRFFHSLDIIAHHYDIEHFCDKRLLELIQYDEVNNTTYTHTLQCYLNMGFNTPATAKKLNIHRNTLDYRLNRIEQLQNIQLHNSDDLFSLMYSFHILTYLHT